MWLYIVFWLWLLYLLTKLCKFVIYQTKLYWLVKDLPGPEIRIPLLGHLSLFWPAIRRLTNVSNDSVEIFNKLLHKYDNEHEMFRLWMGPFNPIVIVTDVKLARKLFANHFDKSSHYRILSFVLGQSLLTCKESKYRKYRHLLNSHFKLNALSSYMCNTMVSLCELNRSIDGIIEQKDGTLSNASQLVSPFVFQTLAENLFSTKFKSIAKQTVPYYIETVFELVSMLNFYAAWAYLFQWRIVIYFLVGLDQILFRRLNQFRCCFYFWISFTKMVRQVYGRLKNDENVPEEFSLLESLVLTEIIQKKSYLHKFQGYLNVMFNGSIFIAGYISTTTAITDILYNLAKYPDVQRKLADEIDNFEQLLIAKGEEMTYLSLKRLHYLNAVIKESIRLNSPLNYIGRMTSTPEVINERITIPAKVDIIISLQHILGSGKYFHEPERFYPERHLERTNQLKEPSDVNWCTETAYIPFSTGLRMCPGRDYSLMQIKLFLINLLSKYSIQFHGQVDHSVQQHITAQYIRNFGLKLNKRS